MIIGVTHNPDGRVIQRLSVSTKVSIGLPPNGDRNHPTKLDHFVFLRKKKAASGVEWERDPELTQHYGDGCRELYIMLIDDDIESVFPSSYAWWTASERKCWGDGASATRRTTEKPGGQPWTPCGTGCPELGAGQCKPSGDLRFVLADFPRLGSVCRIHTSSYRSIRQISSPRPADSVASERLMICSSSCSWVLDLQAPRPCIEHESTSAVSYPPSVPRSGMIPLSPQAMVGQRQPVWEPASGRQTGHRGKAASDQGPDPRGHDC